MKHFRGLSYGIISIFLHEISHIAAALILGKKIGSLNFLPVGFKIVIDEDIEYLWEGVFIYLAGPLTNILLYFLGRFLSRGFFNVLAHNSFIMEFANTNLYLGIFNVLPVIPFDGSKIFIDILSIKVGYFAADKYIRILSLSFSLIFILIGIVQMVWSGFTNFTLVTIGMFVFF